MDNPVPYEWEVELSIENSTSEDVDRAARQLLSELRDLDVEKAGLAHSGAAPEGSKAAELVSIGTIAVAVLPAALPKLIEFLQAWATRARGRTVKFKGKGIEFEGSPEDLQKLLQQLDKSAPQA